MEELRLEVDGGEGQGKGVRAEGTSLEAQDRARSVGAWVVDWLARDKAPPSSQRPLPDPSGTKKSLTSLEGNATLPQSKLDQRLAMQVDPERILLKCRFSVVLTSSQVIPGTQVPGPHFE